MMPKIILILAILFCGAKIAGAKELDIQSLRDGEYVLTDSSLITRLDICRVSYISKAYATQMADGILHTEHPLAVFGKKIQFISSHPLRDNNPFSSEKMVLSELVYVQDLKIWRRYKDIPLRPKPIYWGEGVFILSPAESLEVGRRYALFFGDALSPYGSILPLRDDLRVGVYYFTVSDSTDSIGQ